MPTKLFLFLLIAFPVCAFAQDDVIKEQISMIQAEVPLEYNQIVHAMTVEFISNHDNSTSEMLERFIRHEPHMDSVLESLGLPIELKYMSAALSNCMSTSNYLGARAGWFKMTKNVANKHGLRVNRYVDERRDPAKAIVVFALEMKELNREYKDWKNSFMVYLSSHEEFEYNSKRGIQVYSLLEDYYRFVAATYTIYFHESNNIQPTSIYPKNSVDVEVQQLTTLYQLSSGLKIDYKLFKEMNAIFVREIIPTNEKVPVVIPEEKLSEFKSLGKKLYQYVSVPTYSSTEIKFVGASVPEKKPAKSSPDSTSLVDLIYHIKEGDMLVWIADYYDCTVRELKSWNNLATDMLDIDQPLIVRVPADKKEYYARVDGMTKSEKRELAILD